MLKRAIEAFDGKPEALAEGINIKDLQAKIGQLAMENDFLAGALGSAPPVE